MKFLFASDSFKGSLSSERISKLLEEEAKKQFPECSCIGVAVADGGEGTVDALVKAVSGSFRTIEVKGPLWEERKASYGLLDSETAVIEMAAASGLPLVPEKLRNPLKTTSYGTGEIIRDALDMGCRKISVAIGGSATNDGGMGAMRALGVRFLDAEGQELMGTGADLECVDRLDLERLHPAIAQTEFTVMCDVDNPLLGKDGATYTFGPQKGADAQMLERLEAGMCHYAEVLERQFSMGTGTLSERPGAGAAGGLGAALMGFLHAQLKPGIETVLDLIRFDELLEDVDLVITGEGRIDWQSVHGKVPAGIGEHCKRKKIPVLAIAGGMGKGAEDIYSCGIQSIMSTVNGPMELSEAISRAEELYRSAAERTFRMIRVGLELGRL